MNCFQYGARESLNDFMIIVVNMIHYDVNREFDWDAYLPTLLQASTMLLGSSDDSYIVYKVRVSASHEL